MNRLVIAAAMVAWIGTAAPAQPVAPPWARPGTRMTWFAASASIATVGAKLVPNANGKFIGPGGQSLAPEEVCGQGGGGYTTIDVGHDHAGTMSYVASTYVLADPAKNLVTIAPLAPPRGEVTAGFTEGEYWHDPARLAQLPEGEANGVRVVRMPYPLGGKVYRAIRLIVGTAAGGTIHTYDLDTGLLLFSSTAGASTGLLPGDNGGVTQGQTGTVMAINRLVGVRHVDLPWADDPAPPWTARVRRLDYDGVYRTLIPGVPAIAQPFATTYAIRRRGERFVAFDVLSRGIDGVQQPPAPMASGSATRLGLFLPTPALAKLRAGQVLDVDPTLGTRLVVDRVDAAGATITESSVLSRSEATYDAGGMLVAYRLTQRLSPGTTVAELRLRAAQ